MKRVTISLPKAVYYELQSKAGKERKETDAYIRDLLVSEADVEDEIDVMDEFRQFIIDWDWPEKQLKEGTVQADNVVGVISEISQGSERIEAIKHRTDEAIEEDPNRGSDYEKTVRADCAKKGQGVTRSMDDFEREVEMILEGFQNP